MQDYMINYKLFVMCSRLESISGLDWQKEEAVVEVVEVFSDPLSPRPAPSVIMSCRTESSRLMVCSADHTTLCRPSWSLLVLLQNQTVMLLERC